MEPRSVTAPDGRRIAVEEAGDPAGFPVVVHHGTPSSRLLYGPWADDASTRGIRLIGFDRPGYGGSEPQPGRRVADAAADVEAICEELGLERIATWGISGGGPHALACAALLPDRVACAASLAGVTPFDADGLDWTAGMGESNIEEFAATVEGRDVLAPLLEREREGLLGAGASGLAGGLASLLGAADREVLAGGFADFLFAWARTGLEWGADGWIDDDLAFAAPWGFEPAAIRVPVLVWQGRDDRFVPFAHGEWLAENVPSAEARLTGDGHLTLIEHRVPDVHAWLLDNVG